MSEVKRYMMAGQDWEAVRDAEGKWVRFDEAQSELAALWEELADRCEVIAMKGREVIEAQTAVTGWAAKCKAAEQRNADLVELLGEVWRIAAHPQNVVATSASLKQRVESALNPTESGASE